ncbi:holin [Cytobacillus sp. IB215665]|uniref:holin n=1 Tax=Cytobacillus sp. IB215665 TaxID=3097357 RepID=UPI002A0CAF51|nr:holin [Cytobacillus sp. IB215665]MDX8367867.1 holin [Cytobacillus sp. IB215665]
MNRYKNYGLWVAVAALGLMIIQDLGLQITPEHYNTYVDAILGILVLLGIINNPTTKHKGFRGDK